MLWVFQVWVATATSGTKQCWLCCILVLFSSTCDWWCLYFYLISLVFLLPCLALLCTSSTLTLITSSCRVPGPGPLFFCCLLSLPGRTIHLFSCLCVLFSAYTLLYSSSLSWVFFSFFFSFLRISMLVIHKSLQEGHTDWKPLSPGRMVNCFSLYDSDFLESSILSRSTFIEKTTTTSKTKQTNQKHLLRMILKVNILFCIYQSEIYCRSAILWFLKAE